MRMAISFILLAYATLAYTADKPLNVVVFLVDDLRPDLGCYGNNLIKSPNVDKLAEQGVKFTRAYCQQAICAPSRMSILTGLYPETFAIYDIFTRFDQTHPNALTLPKLFKDNGYKTVSVGKVFHHGLDNQNEWSIYHGKEGNSYHIPGNETLKPAFEGADVADEAYKDGRAAQKAIETLNQLKDDKFLMVVGLSKPHLPFNAPQKYWDLYDKNDFKIPVKAGPIDAYSNAVPKWGELRGYGNIPAEGYLSDSLTLELINGYYACVSYIDAQVGKVMQTLDDLNLRENTMVVFMSDHGWKLGEFGAWCKHSNFNIDINVPFIISRETSHENRKTNVASDAIVDNVDLMPTLAEACDLKIPPREGKSLLPLLDNPEMEWSKVSYSLYAHGEFRMGVTCTNGEYRYVEWREFQTLDLVDIELYPCDENYMVRARNLAHVPAYDSIESVMRELLYEHYPPNGPSYEIPQMPDETIYADDTIVFKSPSVGKEFECGASVKVEAIVGDSIGSLILKVDSVILRTINGSPFVWGLDSLIDGALFTLTSGTHTLQLIGLNNGDTLQHNEINIKIKEALVPQGPYLNSAILIPGRIEAENYDIGSQGLAYFDSDDINESSLYRNDGVDIVAEGTGYCVSNMINREWQEYTINVEEDGYFDIAVYYSSDPVSGSARLSLSLADIDRDLVSNYKLYPTYGWGNFMEETIATDISLEKGEQIVRSTVVQQGYYLDWIEIKNQHTTGTKEVIDASVRIYPNPNSTGLFHLNEICDYRVYSIQGAELISGSGQLVDMSGFRSGVYIFQTNGMTQRIMVK